MLCAVHDQRDKNAVTNAAAVLADWDPLRASTMRCMAFYCSCSVNFTSDNKVTQRAAQKLIQCACSSLGAGSVSQMISLYVILIYNPIIISY